MADLSPKEQLQPSLLDRLADDHPDRLQEPPENRVLTLDQLHDCVIRDLEWLLNSDNFATVNQVGEYVTTEDGRLYITKGNYVYDLDEFPEAAASTVNYGIPTLSGRLMGRGDRRRLEQSIRESIIRFEPRILASTVSVRAMLDETESNKNSLSFEIEGTVWAQPLPIQLLVNAEVDLETGDFKVSEK